MSAAPDLSSPTTDLPPRYDAAAVQAAVARAWEDERLFHAEPTDAGEPFCIVIPPPNVTGALHLGHALNNTVQDILVRRARMQGKNAVWIPGTDHAGISTQAVVDKRLQAEGKPSLKDYKRLEREGQNGREQFIALVQAWKDEYEQRILGQLRAMGCSCDFERTAFTMDEPRARGVREAFFRLFKDGLIYRGKRLVNWDPATQTALADDEVENEEIDGHFYYLRYPLEAAGGASGSSRGFQPLPSETGEGGQRLEASATEPEGVPEYVVVATTRPETMLGDTAVAINPKDPRAAGLRGRFVRLPIVNRLVPIIEDEYVVLPDPGGEDPKAKYATGFLKVTPAHDPNDWDIGQRHDLPVINVFAPDASISDQHGWPREDFEQGDAAPYLGLDRYEARRAIVAWFRENNLLEDTKPYRHSVGHSYRSHVPIEPYLSDQWYVAVRKPIPWMADEGVIDGTDVPKNSLAGLALTALATPMTRHDREGVRSAQPISGTETRDPHPRHTYLITFTTKGTRLHGSPGGSVDRQHNSPGSDFLPEDKDLLRTEADQMAGDRVTLGEPARFASQGAILEVGRHRDWTLHAVHVRTTHVHVVVTADASPERVMNDFKAYATRAMRSQGVAPAEEVWTRHGSTRWLNFEKSVEAAVRYVAEEQGEALSPAAYVEESDATSHDRKGAGSGQPMSGGEAGGQIRASPVALPDGRASSSTLSFVPDRYAKTFRQWHENLRDWCISRQLWWGHRIPVWTLSAEQIRDGRQRVETELGLAALREVEVIAEHNAPRSKPEATGRQRQVCLRDAVEVIKASQSRGWALDDVEMQQDPDVLDTWFSSALWPMSTLGWPAKTPELAAWNPTDVLCTAREIITLWVSRMTMFNRYLLAHPDERVATGHVIDATRPGIDATRDVIDDKGHGIDDKGHGIDDEGHGIDATRHGIDETGHGNDASASEMTRAAGPVPFRTVFIHAMIQDGEGRKMSKSLGNGVDPLDIIDSHGADAMRFTLSQMTTLTQDVRMPVEKDATTGKNTSPKFDIGRNFANKLWNAGRFVIGSIASARSPERERGVSGRSAGPDPEPEPLPYGRGSEQTVVDRWILSRLARTVQSANEAINEYRFDRYATACYDFFWRDFCDWYVEASKPAMKAGGGAAIQTAHVLATCLDVSLRLMHPMIPFATERLWWALNDVMPARGIPGRFDLAPADRLIRAKWPEFDEKMDTLTSTGAERVVERLQEIVQAIRTVRTDNKVDPRRTVPAIIRHPANVAHHLAANKATIELWATCEITAMGEDVAEPENAAKTTAAGCEIFVTGIVDPAAEAGRLARERGDLEKKIRTLRGRLENKGYTEKAPPHLVQQTRDELAQAEAELAARL